LKPGATIMSSRNNQQSARKSTALPRFDIDLKLAYTLPQRTDFLFQIHVLDGIDQGVQSESLKLTPGTYHRVYADPLVGHRFLRVQAPAGDFSLRYKARVEVDRPRRNSKAAEHSIAELPDEVLHNLMPTRYCESDLLASAAVKLFGTLPTAPARVLAIEDWIKRNVDYRIGTSDSTTTACDVFLRRTGVCRDFAHLAVTFCRALNIPARLAVGYAIFETPPPDFHAMFEAWIGGRWELFDPTGLSKTGELVRVAVGRDAKDVAFATIFGAATTRAILPTIKAVPAGD
jgi:transglutaminase-like putative cysteine protease